MESNCYAGPCESFDSQHAVVDRRCRYNREIQKPIRITGIDCAQAVQPFAPATAEAALAAPPAQPYHAGSLAKLSDACSECAKTRHWLQTCVDCEYLDAARFDDLTNQCLVILDELNSMIRESESWQITL